MFIKHLKNIYKTPKTYIIYTVFLRVHSMFTKKDICYICYIIKQIFISNKRQIIQMNFILEINNNSNSKARNIPNI